MEKLVNENNAIALNHRSAAFQGNSSQALTAHYCLALMVTDVSWLLQ